ncbi:hypothetical protein SPI_03443 [Niveomyces insectorum RCEF 264]|uniref:Aminoglycoside phosphotransferase n=1 Tax=Niveomyces insectorum RCEF 264 TaxID=1081102 RepID=A0A162MKF4_9HYPO|nr:hypothetical protein SPI_03443 [Niveomyces insectorum RCEF 264]
MANTIQVGGEKFDYEKAIQSEEDFLHKCKKWLRLNWFNQDLHSHEAQLTRLAAFHLGVDSEAVTIDPKWTAGGFNMVIPLTVRDRNGNNVEDKDASEASKTMLERRFVMRCPIPSSCAEEHHPGTILEKMRCEIASYIWMQRFCPEIRIPQLYGFGLPDGKHMAARLFEWPIPSSYVSVPAPLPLGDFSSGYMLLEHFGPPMGRMLPEVVGTIDINPQDPKAQNLYRSLACLMLAVGRVEQPKIGAFRFNYDGTISLDNRPFACSMMIMENEGAPRTIPPGTTYTSVDSYIAAMIALHDSAFLAAPNATKNKDDYEQQMSVRTFLRAVSDRFISPERHSPFSLWMSDDNTSNIYVDDNWNITGIVDLEWIISVPVDMQCTPFWLYSMEGNSEATTRSGEAKQKYLAARSVFMSILRDEEIKQEQARVRAKRDTGPSSCSFLPGSTLSDAIDGSWTSGRFWFHLCLLLPNAMHNVVRRNILPDYADNENVFNEMWRFWAPNVSNVIAQKLRDRELYADRLSELFDCKDVSKQQNTNVAQGQNTGRD